jgi:3D (Asp-Asp-Asp) domain-containing protein
MTTTGKRAVEGRTMAVDPNIIPYGTELYIDGVGYRIAEDCGGLVKGKHIDVYFDCHSKVVDFGKKYAEVEI